MKVGDLVKLKGVIANHAKVGVVWRIGKPNPIARVLWTDGKDGAMHIKFLEVLNESR